MGRVKRLQAADCSFEGAMEVKIGRSRIMAAPPEAADGEVLAFTKLERTGNAMDDTLRIGGADYRIYAADLFVLPGGEHVQYYLQTDSEEPGLVAVVSGSARVEYLEDEGGTACSAAHRFIIAGLAGGLLACGILLALRHSARDKGMPVRQEETALSSSPAETSADCLGSGEPEGDKAGRDAGSGKYGSPVEEYEPESAADGDTVSGMEEKSGGGEEPSGWDGKGKGGSGDASAAAGSVFPDLSTLSTNARTAVLAGAVKEDGTGGGDVDDGEDGRSVSFPSPAFQDFGMFVVTKDSPYVTFKNDNSGEYKMQFILSSGRDVLFKSKKIKAGKSVQFNLFGSVKQNTSLILEQVISSSGAVYDGYGVISEIPVYVR